MFVIACLGLKSVVFVPGLGGSQLKGRVDKSNLWFCPKGIKDKVFWLNKDYTLPPLYQCLFKWMTMRYDKTKKKFIDEDGVNMGPYNFGSTESMEFLDSGFSHPLINDMDKIINSLVALGYERGKNIFGIPYDWRTGTFQHDSLYTGMAKVIEKAYKNNGNERVILFGHSLGCNVIHFFLKFRTKPDWRAKYIDSVVFVSPMFGGSGLTFDALVEGKIPFLERFNNQYLTDMIRSFGCTYSLLLNNEVFGDDIVSYGPNGEELTADGLKDYLKTSGVLTDTQKKMMEISSGWTYVANEPLDVDTAIVMNTELVSPLGLDMRNNQTKKLYTRGDFISPKKALEWPCNNWKMDKKLVCHDFKDPNPLLYHSALIENAKTIKFIIENYLTSEEWKQ